MQSNELRLLFELAQSKGCKFTSLTYRSTESGELARHTLLVGADYKAALERDLKYIKRVQRNISKKSTDPLFVQAVTEISEGLEKSLSKYDGEQLKKDIADKDVYESIFPGVKQHKDTGAYYLWGMGVSKKVITEGKPSKPTKSKDLTIVKDKIRAKLRNSKYRQFKLNNIDKATVNGTTLNLE